MATESIGDLIPTAIPGYADAADIQAALRAYHYGSYSYNPANTSPASLVTPSMAKTIYDIQQDIVDLENRPSSGGEVNTTQPVPGDFTPPQIPDGFIWVDQDGTLGGQPTGATAVFTNSAPTSNLTTGVIWVDKDSTVTLDNPYIPQAIINAKGDLIVGTGDDDASVLTAASTNGYILAVNSATATGLEWIANDQGDITAVTSGTGISVTNSTGPVPSVAVDTAVVATTNNTLTLSNKTIALGSNTVSGTVAQFNTALTDGDFATLAGTETLTNKTLTSPILTLSTSTPTFTTNAYTLVSGDQYKFLLASNGATAGTINIPTNSSVAFPIGTQITIIQTGAGQLTITATTPATTTILSTGATAASPKLRVQYSSATLIKTATDAWYVVGDIA